jgi:hypothetical protein
VCRKVAVRRSREWLQSSIFSAMDAMDQGAVFSSLCYNKRIDITDTRRGGCWNSCKWVLAAGDGRNAGNWRI